jgi:hypothetical protein
MYQLYFAERDTTLYERYPYRNTGIDSVIELTKITSGTKLEKVVQSNTYNSRILLDFGNQITALRTAINSGLVPPIGLSASNSASVYLNLRCATATDLPTDYTIYAFPVSQSWTNGNGNYNDVPEVRNGASWYYRDNEDLATVWNTGSAHSKNDTSATILQGGGTWITGSTYEASQSFSYEQPDVRMNVTDIVKRWIAQDIPNYGFIVKRSKTDERSGEILGSIKFYGVDTNTIYVPRLEVAWNDTVYSLGNNTAIDVPNYIVYISNLRDNYRESERARFDLGVRPMYPNRNFATSSYYFTNNVLPTGSYYSIKDAVTNETIIPYDDYATKVSCDANGSFFNLRLNTFMPERYYKIELKIQRSVNDIQIHDNGFYFKVVR